MIQNHHLASVKQHRKLCSPPLWLAPIAAQQQQHCQQHQRCTRPVEAGAAVTMVQETAPPHLLQRESSSQHSWNTEPDIWKSRMRKGEDSSWCSRENRSLQNPWTWHTASQIHCVNPSAPMDIQLVSLGENSLLFSWLEKWKSFCARLSHCHRETKEHF